jgi:glucosamine--fructose-6-phosphate aminotransferase (isomerizing)
VYRNQVNHQILSAVLKEGRRQGCLTLAITNVTDSPLAKMADYVLDIQAGTEKAVAATKTYTAELWQSQCYPLR